MFIPRGIFPSFFPRGHPSDSVVVSPYVSLAEQGELATSLGLGFRYLVGDQSGSASISTVRRGFLTKGFYVGASTTTPQTTVKPITSLYEQGMEGWNIEAAFPSFAPRSIPRCLAAHGLL